MIKKIDHFNLKQICDSGQCFRWRKISDNLFVVPAFGKILFIRDLNKNFEFDFSCTEDEWNSIWIDYFDLKRDYNSIEKRIINGNDSHLIESFRHGDGIRILKQDLWEIIFSFMISQNNNIKRISKSIELVCEKTNLSSEFLNNDFYLPEDISSFIVYRFPSANEISPEIFDDTSMGFGYRAPYLKEMCEYVSSNPEWIDYLRTLDYETAFKELVSMKGIGPKVANCICLFGLNHVEAFPVDTHVKKLLEKYYSDGIDLSLYPDEAGIIQQYLFYFELSNK